MRLEFHGQQARNAGAVEQQEPERLAGAVEIREQLIAAGRRPRVVKHVGERLEAIDDERRPGFDLERRPHAGDLDPRVDLADDRGP